MWRSVQIMSHQAAKQNRSQWPLRAFLLKLWDHSETQQMFYQLRGGAANTKTHFIAITHRIKVLADLCFPCRPKFSFHEASIPEQHTWTLLCRQSCGWQQRSTLQSQVMFSHPGEHEESLVCGGFGREVHDKEGGDYQQSRCVCWKAGRVLVW